MRRPLAFATAAIIAIGLIATTATPASALPAGALDPAFGVGGLVVADFSDFAQTCSGPRGFGCTPDTEGAAGLAGQPSGAVVVLTTFSSPFVAGGKVVEALVRFRPDGTLDPAFGTGGAALLGPIATEGQLAQDAAGRLYVEWTPEGAVVQVITRLTADGLIDPGYGTGGHAFVALGSQTVIAADGSAYRYRTTDGAGGEPVVLITRLGPTGAADGGFGVGGTAIVTFPLASPEGWRTTTSVRLAVTPEGRVLLATAAAEPDILTRHRVVLARLEPGGALDPTFSPAGGFAFPTGPSALPDLFQFRPTAVSVRPNGQILLGGSRSSAYVGSSLDVVRVSPSLAPDVTFGSGGRAVVDLKLDIGQPLTAGEALDWLAVDDQGRILVKGSFIDLLLPDQGQSVTRLTSTGAVDPTYGIGGRVDLGTALWAPTLALVPGGGLLVGGPLPRPDRCGGYGTACTDIALVKLRG